jgi:hypothetical protein
VIARTNKERRECGRVWWREREGCEIQEKTCTAEEKARTAEKKECVFGKEAHTAEETACSAKRRHA